MSNIPTRPEDRQEGAEQRDENGAEKISPAEVEKIVDSHRTEKPVEDLGGEID